MSTEKREGRRDTMDYKSVIEEQIRELQKVQDSLSKRIEHNELAACEVAKTIAVLCDEAEKR